MGRQIPNSPGSLNDSIIAWVLVMRARFVLIVLVILCFTPSRLPVGQMSSSLALEPPGESSRPAQKWQDVPFNLAAWRSQPLCGVNCLYALLRAHDLEVDYDQLVSATVQNPSKPVGLNELREGAQKRGLRCATGKATGQSLDALPKPLIAHIDLQDYTQAPDSGHFVLIVATNADSVIAMDGTTGMIQEHPRAGFDRVWTGYVLYSVPDEGRHWLTVVLVVGGCLLGAWALERFIVARFIRRCLTS